MDNAKLNYFKTRLLNEKSKIEKVIEERNPKSEVNTNVQMANELSVYDDHTGDSAGDLLDTTIDISLSQNEKTILNKIDNSLKKIENGTYGLCDKCGKEISNMRLEFMPYAENCIECQNEINNVIEVEEHSLNRLEALRQSEQPSYYAYKIPDHNVYKFNNGFENIAGFTDIDEVYDEFYYDDNYYVDPIDSISNEQYKNQLPY